MRGCLGAAGLPVAQSPKVQLHAASSFSDVVSATVSYRKPVANFSARMNSGTAPLAM